MRGDGTKYDVDDHARSSLLLVAILFLGVLSDSVKAKISVHIHLKSREGENFVCLLGLKTYALILRHFVSGVLAQPTRVACSVPEDCPTMGEYCNEETGTCDPGMSSTWSAVCQRNISPPQESSATRSLALVTQVCGPHGLQCAREIYHRHRRVLQWGDWHLRPRYVIHMVCSVPEKYLVAIGEFCNEETGTCDPGRWLTWPAGCQINASSPQESIATRTLAFATQVGDKLVCRVPEYCPPSGTCPLVVEPRGLQCAREISRRHRRVLQRGDWHLRPRYVIHMVYSVPEKYLVARGESCNEETGTCDPGR